MKNFAKCLGHNVLVVAVLLVAVLFGVTTQDFTRADRPDVVQSSSSIMFDNDCWVGEAPADMAGKIPGHVVVSKPDQAPRLGGSHLVGQALDQIFNGHDHNLTVHGFCR